MRSQPGTNLLRHEVYYWKTQNTRANPFAPDLRSILRNQTLAIATSGT